MLAGSALRMRYVVKSETGLFILIDKRYSPHSKPFNPKNWNEDIKSLLVELHQHDACEQGVQKCYRCSISFKDEDVKISRCIDCHNLSNLCSKCVIEVHDCNPLHHIDACQVFIP